MAKPLGASPHFVTKNEDDILPMPEFLGCLETLQDSGLLDLEARKLSGRPLREVNSTTIRLGYQLEDVQLALDKVCPGEYYKTVAEAAKKTRHDW